MTLKEVGRAAGDMDYTAVAMAIRRFEKKAGEDQALREVTAQAQAKCEK